MTIDLDKLEQLARAVTPGGNWFQVQDKVYRNDMVKGETFSDGFVCDTHDGPVERARFIAAANPAAVLELVQRLRAAEAIARDLAAAFHLHDTDPNQRGAPCRLCLGVQGDHREECPGRRAVEATKP